MVGAEDSGDDRLSRQRHYHGPGGLNGRVRDGNGWDPAGIVAGKAAGGRLGPRRSHWRWFGRLSHNPGGGVAHSLHDGSLTGLRHGGRTWTRPAAARPRGGAARPRIGVVKSLGCWDWSAAAVARRALPAHRPGRLPGAFDSIESGSLVSERASRLDAFSAYPFPTWLPGDAPSGTAGTPEVGPPQSSRTRGDLSQVSYTHGR